MPRYFFVVHDGHGQSDDDDGLELLDLASARNEAIAGARSMMSDSIGRGTLDLTAYIVIENDRHTEVDCVRFRDVVSILG
jgi:hypothetical protein